ncbi:MAG: PepSY domain-containing protein, partial [Verrucomicrobiota bacterium]
WEIQVDHQTGEVLGYAYRRSDLIESIHDGSFFHDKVKLGIFLPSAVILLLLWITGIYLFIYPLPSKLRHAKRTRERKKQMSAATV